MQKKSDKFQHPFMIQTLRNSARGKLPLLDKEHVQKPYSQYYT